MSKVDDTYPCVKCGKDASEDYLVPNVGMVCDGCMTDADLDAWHAHNKLHNPDSYDKDTECDYDCTCAHDMGMCAHDCMHCNKE